MNIVKKIISLLSIIAMLGVINVSANVGDAYVDEDTGELVIPGDPEVRIAPPEGEVVDGNLHLPGEVVIPRPQATVLEDGRLEVEGEIFDVPAIPVTVALDLFPFGGNAYFHDMIGTLWTVEGENWAFLNMFSGLDQSGWIWVATSVATDVAIWVYSVHFDDWVYFAKEPSTEGGLKSITQVEGEGGFQNGFIYLVSEEAWRFYFENEVGGFLNESGVDGEWIQTFTR